MIIKLKAISPQLRYVSFWQNTKALQGQSQGGVWTE